MNVLKLSFLFLISLSNGAFAANCETFQGYQLKEKLCWNQSIRGWITASCLDEGQTCQAKKLFLSKIKMPTRPLGINGQNPAALICHQLKLEVLILKDSHNQEQSFCRFKDQSMIDANAIERNVK